MDIIHINPCRPFDHMARKADYEEILVDSLARAFNLTLTSRLLVDEAVHHAYAKYNDVIMRDIMEEIWTLRERFGEASAFELCALLNCMIDNTYAETAIFCERDGLAINALDVDQLKALYRTTSNRGARAFIENLIVYSLMF